MQIVQRVERVVRARGLRAWGKLLDHTLRVLFWDPEARVDLLHRFEELDRLERA